VKIQCVEIKERPLHLVAEEKIEDYPALQAMQNANEGLFLSPVRIDLTVFREHDLIRTHGHVAMTVRLACSRCLNEFDAEIDSPFTIFFTRAAGEPQDEEVELTEEDLISASYDGDEINFSPFAEEQVLLGIPVKPLCQEECRGLCATCGADLNNADCACDRAEPHLKFSALRNLKIEH
jgi:uncharacterized protein